MEPTHLVRCSTLSSQTPYRAVWFLLGAALCLAAGPALAAPPEVVWGKTGGSVEVMLEDLQVCQKEALTARPSADSDHLTTGEAFGYGYSPLGTAIGLALSNLIVGAVETRSAQRRYIPRCMHRRDYHALSLSLADRAQTEGLKTPEETARWLAAVYARPDFAARVAAAALPPLPEAKPEPLTYGGVRFDPATLTVAEGAVQAGGVLLHGNVSHRRSGRLMTDVPLAVFGHGKMTAGEVVHLVVFPTEDPQGLSYWCGPIRSGPFKLHACVRNDGDDTYAAVASKGATWLATDLDVDAGATSTWDVACKVEESADDLAGPIGFDLVLRKMGPTSVVLEALVSQGDDTETMWKKTLPLGPDGRAMLPFWTYRLVVARAGAAVTAAFTPDGDGSGWSYEPVTE